MSVQGIAGVAARMAQLQGLVQELSPTATTGTGAAGTLGSTAADGSSTGTRFAGALAALTGLGTSSGSASSGVATGSAGTVTGFGASAGVSGSGLGSDGVARGLQGAQGVTGEALVAAAKRYVGTPYVWGGETLAEGGLDCSGLVIRSLGDLGVSGMPRVARDQMHMGTEVPSLDQARPGDLVVFGGGSHIGIYVGDGKMIDAPKPGGHVSVRDVYETPTTIRRILPAASSGALPVGQSDVATLAALLGGSAAGTTSTADLLGALSGTAVTGTAGSGTAATGTTGIGAASADASRGALDLLLSLSEVTS